jgi:hypothetical protein
MVILILPSESAPVVRIRSRRTPSKKLISLYEYEYYEVRRSSDLSAQDLQGRPLRQTDSRSICSAICHLELRHTHLLSLDTPHLHFLHAHTFKNETKNYSRSRTENGDSRSRTYSYGTELRMEPRQSRLPRKDRRI